MTDTAVSAFPVAASVALTDYIPCVVGGTTSRASFTVVRAAILPVVLTADVSGVLPTANGGWSASAAETLSNKTIAGASNTLSVRIASDVTGLGASVAAFLATPSGANLATALTTALTAAKGGTGLTALGTNVATLLGTALAAGVTTFLATPTGANLAALLTSALPVSKGGTGATASTGSGNVVLAASPTLAGPTFTGTTILAFLRASGVTANASSATLNDLSFGGNVRLRFTGAPTITGLDATGVADGEIRFLHTDTTSVTLNHEDGLSLAANRFKLRSAAARTLVASCVVPVMYDGTAARWVLFGADYTNP